MTKKTITSEPKKCIYCCQTKNFSNDNMTSEYDREHVVQDGLLRDIQQPLILYGRVCKICNNTFGKKIDQWFLRSGYTGQFRFYHGLKKVEEYGHFAQDSLTFSVRSPHIKSLEGAPVATIDKNGKLVAVLEPKVSVETKMGWVHLTERQIDIGEIPNAADLAPNGGVKFSCDDDEEEMRVSTKLQRFISFLPSNDKYTIGTVNVLGEGAVTEKEVRAFAKIGFNYLAHIFERELNRPDLIFAPCFDEIRNFIQNNVAPKYEYVMKDRDDLLPTTPTPEMPNRERHLVGLYFEGDVVFARVRLFNAMVWKIILTFEYAEPGNYRSFCHEWNLQNKTCLPASKQAMWE